MKGEKWLSELRTMAKDGREGEALETIGNLIGFLREYKSGFNDPIGGRGTDENGNAVADFGPIHVKVFQTGGTARWQRVDLTDGEERWGTPDVSAMLISGSGNGLDSGKMYVKLIDNVSGADIVSGKLTPEEVNQVLRIGIDPQKAHDYSEGKFIKDTLERIVGDGSNNIADIMEAALSYDPDLTAFLNSGDGSHESGPIEFEIKGDRLKVFIPSEKGGKTLFVARNYDGIFDIENASRGIYEPSEDSRDYLIEGKVDGFDVPGEKKLACGSSDTDYSEPLSGDDPDDD